MNIFSERIAEQPLLQKRKNTLYQRAGNQNVDVVNSTSIHFSELLSSVTDLFGKDGMIESVHPEKTTIEDLDLLLQHCDLIIEADERYLKCFTMASLVSILKVVHAHIDICLSFHQA